MKTEWEVKKLGEVCEFINGKAYKKPELLAEGKYPVLRVGNFFTSDQWYYSDLELDKDKYCDSGDLLYAWSASFGPRIWKGGKVIYHYHIWKIIPNLKLISKEFLFRLLDWDVDKIKEDQGKGTTMTHVGKGSIENRSVIIPPLAEQQRIVAILDEAFAAIDKAKVNAQKNLQNARELFDSYLQLVFANPGEDWEEKTLGKIAEFRNGLNFTKSSKGEAIKIVGVKDFQKNYWVPSENLETVTTSGILNGIDCLKEGDILAVRSNGNQELIGRCILAGPVLEKTSHSGFTIRIRLNQHGAFPSYVCHFLKSKEARKQLVESGTGTNIKSLNQGALSSLNVPLPSFKDQQAIVNQIEVVFTETKKLEAIYQQKLTDLDELKKAILQKAFQGELTTASADALTA